MLDNSPYQGYLYAYPHKTSYQPLRPRPLLREVWADEPRDSLFLYVHIPFCEARCGFCNLLSQVVRSTAQVATYLRHVEIQAEQVAEALGPATFVRAAIGGGTPTVLTSDQLTTLITTMTRIFGFHPDTAGLSVETSPRTATPDRIDALAAHGTRRISIGVQSFLDIETSAIGRPQHRAEVERALDTIRHSRVDILNIDLIYGIPGQTPTTWSQSLHAALSWQPEEIYLYPLYVRPLTGLGMQIRDQPDPQWDTQRMELYQQGRDLLHHAGYTQLSMRHFRRADLPDPPMDYCCQEDGMVGLGCGARSYTRHLHYSFDYAVGVPEVRAILDDYVHKPAESFTHAEIGLWLDEAEQRVRWVVKSLLRVEGIDINDYKTRFGTSVEEDFSHLEELTRRGWAEVTDRRISLTPEGLAHSDAIGPWLASTVPMSTPH